MWKIGALRLMENSFDAAHIAFVHKATFGDINRPKPEKYYINETDYGFVAETVHTVVNPPKGARITGSTDPTTKRIMCNIWYMPLLPPQLRHSISVRHSSHHLQSVQRRIGDDRTQVVQLLFRNDTEADCSTQELIDWDAAIIAEDREMLESTDHDAIIDMSRKIEMHMPSDRPGMIMRDRLLALLHAHNEDEQPKRKSA